ncbi:MAG TPA: glycosyl hydrolase, partial [Paludibacter sp.]|nr:glycosyl hydrolase [Paludibacter sp.]
MKKLQLLIFLTCFFGFVRAQRSLVENFKNPPSEARPRTFWHWVHGAVSKEGVKADLIAMKEIGLEGPSLFTIRDPKNEYFDKPIAQLSPGWFEMLRYTMHICDSLGLKFSMHISDGFALAGGPWISPAESMQKVVFTDTIIKGGKIKNLTLRQPETIENYYEDIEIYALYVKTQEEKNDYSIKLISEAGESTLSHSPEGEGLGVRFETPCNIQFHYSKPFTLKTIVITPSGTNIQSQRLKILASNDGENFYEIKQLIPPRQGWQNTGFTTTFAVTPTTAKYFRLFWTPEGTEPGSEDLDAAKWKPTLKIKNIELSETARIDNWEGKSGIIWRIAPEMTETDYSSNDFTPVKKIIRLKANFVNGKLNCKLPKGYWRIVRMGHTTTGHTNATGGPGKGLECDKFSEKAVQKQFDNWIGAIINKTDPELAKKVMKEILIDSWECGSQNWSENFSSEFAKRRGYDLMPYLPLLAGFPIESAQKSEQVLFDVRLTISDLVTDVFFKVMRDNAHKYGCELMAESVAPTFVNDGMEHFKMVDRPMGEFWFRSPTHDKPMDMLDAISGAHIYGKNIVQAEGFTQLRTNWDEHPAMLKPLLDRQFALGINKLFFHVFVQNPKMDQSPGTTLSGMGLLFQRNQTWWKPGKAFVDYIARCQAMLQYGKPVVDIAVFTGEEIPRRALTPDRLVPYLPGIIGKERVQEEKARLANVGQLMSEMPVGVSHSANVFTLENWINPLKGYAYDSFNKDVFLSAKAENSTMILGDGLAYKVLIFPKGMNYSDEILAKIDEMKQAGVLIPELPVEDSLQIEPDVIAPKNIAWTHRTGDMGDVYFVSNQENTTRDFEISFRNIKNKPTQWNPNTGEIDAVNKFAKSAKHTHINLSLAPYE